MKSMENLIYQHLLAHKSCRKFKAEPIAQDVIDRILTAGSRAPTAGNLQNYSVIVTENESRRGLLSEIHFSMPMIKEAPLVLTVCVDVSRNSIWAESHDADLGFSNLWGFYVGMVDAVSFAQNVVVAAEAEGLGTCHSGATFQRSLSLIDFFKCPMGVIPVVTLAIGHIAEDSVRVRRLPMNAVVMRETYEIRKQDEINDLYSEKEITDWERYLIEPGTYRKVKELGLNHLAQVYGEVKYRREDSETFAENFITALVKQGFVKVRE